MKQTNSSTSVFSEEILGPAAGIQAPMMERMESRQLMSVSVDTSTLAIVDTSSGGDALPLETVSLNYSKIVHEYRPTTGLRLTLGHKLV